MSASTKLSELALAAFDTWLVQAEGNARKLAALAIVALDNGLPDRAYEVARQARAIAPGDPDIRSMTDRAINQDVPRWHFGIVRDDARNAAYEGAIKRATRPDMRVLDIGAGTGLLALMAARAGAREVITCEMNRAVADAASDIVAASDYSGRVRVVAKRSTDLDVDADMGGPADLLISEIISNDMLSQSALAVMQDAASRLLKPGARMIPAAGRVRVALAYWAGLDARRMRDVAGFDMTAFNRLDHVPQRVKTGDPGLTLRSPPADLFEFDFESGGPFGPGEASVTLMAEGGPVNGIVQWIKLRMDAEGTYENRPGPGANSCWAALFYPLDSRLDPEPGIEVRICGAHSLRTLRIWAAP